MGSHSLFYEQSSAGKTTTANVASGLYGDRIWLRLTWYGTALGLASDAAALTMSDAYWMKSDRGTDR
jgi:putative DNA primase/helicase